MRTLGIMVALTLASIGSACVDDMTTAPTPLVNSQLAGFETRIAELEHQLAVCYAGHELERGEEGPFLPASR